MKTPKKFPLASKFSIVEPLESRIAPAILNGFVVPTVGSATLLVAGTDHAGLATSSSGGSYMMYLEKGAALVFSTDINGNSQIDYDEITGIAAGDGMRMISFVDIHGDIVTNLNSDYTLTDSNNDATDGRDGKVLLNNKIEKIELRSIRTDEISAETAIQNVLALSNYSIMGNIYAGGGFGADDGGLIINTSGKNLQSVVFAPAYTGYHYIETNPTIGSIKVGSAAGGEHFSFGSSPDGFGLDPVTHKDIVGFLQPFIQPANQDGASINGFKVVDGISPVNVGTFGAGNGGYNGAGGNVKNIAIPSDTAGGYALIAGNAGVGPVGKSGGSIIGYSDHGSVTSLVRLETGDGGRGTSGAGGNGGIIELNPADPIDIGGRIIITLGNGGDGFGNGGNAGSIPKATFETTGNLDDPFVLALVSGQRLAGDIGNAVGNPTNVLDPMNPLVVGSHRDIDFDNDGINDFVYTSARPDQLVVVFGGLAGTLDPTGVRAAGASPTIYLNTMENPGSLLVSDFNGDGRPDIVVASSENNQSGIAVYLNKADESGKFVGFTDAIYTSIPGLFGYQDLHNVQNGTFGFFANQAIAVVDLNAGDYDGDGIMDLAVNTKQDSGNAQVIFILRGDAAPEDPTKGNGHFYADFIHGIPALISTTNDEADIRMHTSAQTSGVGPDYLFFSREEGTDGSNLIFKADYSDLDIYFDGFSTLFSSSLSIGKVDVDRKLPGDDGNHINLKDAKMHDFVLFDMDGDAFTDIGVWSEADGSHFLILMKGDGAGNFSIVSFNPTGVPDITQNLGIKLTGSEDGSENIDDDNSDIAGILVGNASPDGTQMNGINFMLFTLGHILDSQYLNFAPGEYYNPTPGSTDIAIGDINLDDTVRVWDTYRSVSVDDGISPDSDDYGFVFGAPTKNFDDALVGLSFDAGFDLVFIVNNGLSITAGDGGDSITGKGGYGGNLGSNTLKNAASFDELPTGSLTVIIPEESGYNGFVSLISGAGGDGYLDGGKGGSLTGVAVQTFAGPLTYSVYLEAGAGGDSLTRTGGAGGNLSNLAIQAGYIFIAGDGGSGVYGGLGGSVIGNNLKDVLDNTSSGDFGSIEVYAGNGGSGIKKGGNGGSITKFQPNFLPIEDGDGYLIYQAGNGGNSISGSGGNGGSVISSSPAVVVNDPRGSNFLSGDISVFAGNGGNGSTGGSGGNVTDFVNSPGRFNPSSVKILGGNGGVGYSGNGGSGGTISKVNVTSGGFSDVFVREFNRYIAGSGGGSYSSAGGNGGALSNIVGITTATSFVAVSGEGGVGLKLGGNGGNITDARLSAAATSGSKVLVIAGEGGNVYSATLDPSSDPLAYGGSNGKGGNGGSIIGLVQDGDNVRIDLIAGNGGGTVNQVYNPTKSYVGVGGSIKNIAAKGNIGNIDNNVAIKSYNDIFTFETMSSFVKTVLIGDDIVDVQVNDLLGNVGIVVGESGRVKDSNNDGVLDPTNLGINGKLDNVVFSNLLSAIAGSVSRIASIQSITNIRSSSGTSAVFGADKADVDIEYDGTPLFGVGTLNVLDYFDPSGVLITLPELGGFLIDGAIVGKNDRQTFGGRDKVISS